MILVPYEKVVHRLEGDKAKVLHRLSDSIDNLPNGLIGWLKWAITDKNGCRFVGRIRESRFWIIDTRFSNPYTAIAHGRVHEKDGRVTVISRLYIHSFVTLFVGLLFVAAAVGTLRHHGLFDVSLVVLAIFHVLAYRYAFVTSARTMKKFLDTALGESEADSRHK